MAGRFAAEVLDYIAPHVRAGITTDELDRLCHGYMVECAGHGARAAELCPAGLSPVSKVDLHLGQSRGVPRHSRETKRSRTATCVNIDVTVIKDGYHGEPAACTYVGEPSIQARRLVRSHVSNACGSD